MNLFGELFIHELAKMCAEIVMSAVFCNGTIFADRLSASEKIKYPQSPGKTPHIEHYIIWNLLHQDQVNTI